MLRKWSDARASKWYRKWMENLLSVTITTRRTEKKHNWIAIDKWHKIKINGNVDDEDGDDDGNDDGGGNNDGPNGSGNQRVRKIA